MRKLMLLTLLLSLLICLPASAQEDEDTAQEAANRLAYMGFIEELWREHNVPLWDTFVATDFVYHASTGDMTSQQLLQSYQQNDIGLIPDLTTRWYDTLAEGDIVVAPFVLQGSCPEDPFFPNRACDSSGVDIMRVQDGKLAEYWKLTDSLYAYRQWGFEPAEGPQQPVTASLVAARAEGTLLRSENKLLAQEAINLFAGVGRPADVFAPGVVVHLPLSLYPEPLDLGGYQRFISDYQTAFPGFTLAPRTDIARNGMIADANLVAFLYTFRGMFMGEAHGLTPTLREVTYPGAAIYRITGDKISEVWFTWDTFSELTQMQATEA